MRKPERVDERGYAGDAVHGLAALTQRETRKSPPYGQVVTRPHALLTDQVGDVGDSVLKES